MGTIDTLLRIKADARQAVAGLKPLQTALDTTAKDAESTEKALNDLSGSHSIHINDQAVENARKEIERLRQQVREDLRLDVNADTRVAERRIKSLQSSVRTLDAKHVVVEVDADTKKAESKISGIGSTAKSAAAGVGIATIAKGLFDAAIGASLYETNMRAVNVVLGETVQTDLTAWIEDNADALNLTQVAASDAARSYSLYADKAEAAGIPAQRFTEDLIRVAAEAAAFSGQRPAEAVEAIGAAMRGEFDSLERFGINLTQAQIDAEGLATGMLSANGEWAEGGKQAATYNLMLQQAGPLMGSVGRNSDTLGGKMSDLSQNAGDLATSLGNDLAPVLEDLASTLNEVIGPLDELLKKRREWIEDANAEDEGGFRGFLDKIKVLTTGSLGDVIGQGKDLASDIKDIFRHGDFNWSEQQAAEAAELEAANKKAAEETENLVTVHWDVTGAVEAHAAAMEELSGAVDRTSQKYQDLKDSFTAFNDGLIEARTNVYDYQGAIDDLAESLVKSGTFSPDLEAGRENWGNLVAFAESASERVEDTWVAHGKGAAVKMQEAQRNTLHQMLVDAGIESSKAWGIVNQVMKKPHQIELEIGKIDLSGLRAQRAKLLEKKEELLLPVKTALTPRAADEASIDAQKKIKPIDTKLQITQDSIDEATGKADEVAKPGGKDRKAPIKVIANTDQADDDINNFIKLRRSHVKIYVDIVPPEGPILGPPSGVTGQTAGPAGLRAAGAAMLASPTPTATGSWVPTLTAPRRAQSGGGGQTVQLAPKQTPVAVYLDGVEIAHRIEARRAMAATTSVRRMA
jgi:hypothetical protein